MPQNTPEGRGQESHHAADHMQSEMGFVKKSKNTEGQAMDRIQAASKKVDNLRLATTIKDVRSFVPSEKQIDAAVMSVIKGIEAKANALKNALSEQVVAGLGTARAEVTSMASDALFTTLVSLRSQPTVVQQPTSEMLEALVTIGKANKESQDPKVQAEVQELRALVIEMQGRLAAQPAAVPTGMPNIVINNNLAPQNGPQAPAQAVEKKVEQQGWQEEGQGLMYQVSSINQRIKILKEEYDQKTTSGKDPAAEKAFRNEVDALISQRKQLLRTVNSVIESARKPSDDRNQIAATTEETVLTMNRWLNDMGQNRGGLTVFKGEYKVM